VRAAVYHDHAMYYIDARALQFSVAAQDAEQPDSRIVIPKHELVTWHSDLRDWRRVKISWNGHVYVVSRTAWDNALPGTSCQGTPRNKRHWLDG
jgi:hypothetical protein